MFAAIVLSALLVPCPPQTPGTPLPSPAQNAVAAAKRALEEVLAGDGKETRAAADAWRTLARAHSAARQANEAVAALHAQLALRERFTDELADRVELAMCRVDLAGALRAAERYDDALDVLANAESELQELARARLEPQKWALLRVGYLTTRAQILMLQGNHGTARPMLEDALTVAIEGLGEHAPNTQVVRQSLATLFALTGEPERARELAAKALTAAEAVNGADHLKTAHAAYALGQFERLCGRNDDAARSLTRAVAIRRARLGNRHPDTLAAMFASTQMLVATHQVEAARAELVELLAATRAELGPDHHQTVDVAAMLAEVLAELQDAPAALPLITHVLERRLAARGERIGPVLAARQTLARVLHAVGRADEAVAQLEKVLADDDGSDPEIARHAHQRLANFLPAVGREREALEHARTNLRDFDAFLDARLPVMLDKERLAFVQKRRQDLEHILSWARSEGEVAAAHRDGMAWKARVARGLFAQRAWLRRNLDAATVATLDELQTTLARLAAARYGEAALRDRLQQQVVHLQASLPAAHTVREPVDAAAIHARLRPGEALVDFYVYERAERLTTVGPHVVAFVVAAGKAPVRVDLGPLAAIEVALQAQLRMSSRRTKVADAASRTVAEAVGARLRALLWQPLVASLGEGRRVYVCGDGAIALLPFAAMPGAEPGTFLVEQHEFVSLVSPTDLLRPPAHEARSHKAVIVGEVDYETRSVGEAAAPAGPAGLQRESGAATVTRQFARLPRTADEVTAIGKALAAAAHEVVTLRGADATGAALVAASKGARIVHLATHGEFGTVGSPELLPGQRGGIALAGANARGVFTTDEIAWLDLADCDLAVLSACDTAIGETTAGEHVLGLRRALRLAGARATITSAWAIDDAATGELMADFYRRLVGGAAPAVALRQAQLALLAKNRAAGDAMPGTWGAFLFEGG